MHTAGPLPLEAKDVFGTDIVAEDRLVYTLIVDNLVSRQASKTFLRVKENGWPVCLAKTSVQDKSRVARVADS